MGEDERLDQVVTGVEGVALGAEAVRAHARRPRPQRRRGRGDLGDGRFERRDRRVDRPRPGEAEAHAERRPGGDARLPVAEAELADVEVVRVVDVDEDVIVDVGVEPPFQLARVRRRARPRRRRRWRRVRRPGRGRRCPARRARTTTRRCRRRAGRGPVGSSRTTASARCPARQAASVPLPVHSSSITASTERSPVIECGSTSCTASSASQPMAKPAFMSPPPRPYSHPSRRTGWNGGASTA